MTKKMSPGKVVLLIAVIFALMGAAAFLQGLIEKYLKEDIDPDAYGLASLYEGGSEPVMSMFLWQGRADGDPDTVKEGFTPTGDVHGNSGAFSLHGLTVGETADTVEWTGFEDRKFSSDDYALPVFTIKNKFGGKIRAVYEHSTERDPDDPTKVTPALIFSTDTTRVPEEFHLYLGNGMWQGRKDVQLDWNGMGETEGIMVLNLAGAGRLASSEKVYFNDLYPGGDTMKNVYRTERESTLLLYAMDPYDEDRILAEAKVKIVCYSRWMDPGHYSGGSVSIEQMDELRRLDVSSHAGALVTVESYEETLILE